MSKTIDLVRRATRRPDVPQVFGVDHLASLRGTLERRHTLDGLNYLYRKGELLRAGKQGAWVYGLRDKRLKVAPPGQDSLPLPEEERGEKGKPYSDREIIDGMDREIHRLRGLILVERNKKVALLGAIGQASGLMQRAVEALNK